MNNESYWKNWERQRLIVERKYNARLKKIFKSRINDVISAIEIGGLEYGKSSLNFDFLNQDLVNVYRDLYKESSVRFANIVYRELLLTSRKGANFGFNEEWAQEAARFLGLKGLPMISTVTGNLRDLILSILESAIVEGLTNSLGLTDIISNVITRLKELGIEKSNYWAERIARTETVRGANYGAMQGARKSPYKKEKIWIATHDKRTRDSHWSLDNQVRELEKPFHNYEDIMQPGDPDASPANTINCRCAVAFQFLRDANGKLIKQ